MNGTHYDFGLVRSKRKKTIKRKELAVKLGVSDMTLYRVETGEGTSYDLLFKICCLLDIDIKEIIKSDIEAAGTTANVG